MRKTKQHSLPSLIQLVVPLGGPGVYTLYKHFTQLSQRRGPPPHPFRFRGPPRDKRGAPLQGTLEMQD